MKSQGLLIGADPELFIKDTTNGVYISAHDVVPGNKIEPFPVQCGAIQADGTAAEFNIDATDDSEVFVSNIKSVTEQLTICVQNHLGSNFVLTADPVADYGVAYMRTLPFDAKLLGCEPDYDAWNEARPNKRPNGNVAFRTGGGHIHVGWTQAADAHSRAHMADCVALVKQLDAALYIPSTYWDPSDRRRELYGKMGSFRPKSYGVEYRPLSNAWVADPYLAEWIFVTVSDAFHLLYDEEVKLYEAPVLKEALQDVSSLTDSDRWAVLNELEEWELPPLPIQYHPKAHGGMAL